MQQTLEVGFWQRARFGGVLRYHTKALGRRVLLVLLILLLVLAKPGWSLSGWGGDWFSPGALGELLGRWLDPLLARVRG